MRPQSRRPVWRAGAPVLALAFAALVLGAPSVASEPATGPVEVDPEPVPQADHEHGDLFTLFGDDVEVPAGTVRHGKIVSIGGRVVVRGHVTGDVVLVWGELIVDGGHVGGDVVSVLGDRQLRDARLDRDLVCVLGSIDMRSSRVGRDFVNVLGALDRDASSTAPLTNISFGRFPLWSLLLWVRLVFKLLAFVLVVLLVALAPERVRRIAESAQDRYVPAFFVGILGWLGLFVVGLVLSVTVVGFPLALLGIWVLKWLGIAGIFCAVGLRLGRAFGAEPPLLVAVLIAFGGYLLLAVVPTAFGPFGFLFAAVASTLFVLLVEVPAVGLIVLTRAGGRPRRVAIPAPGPVYPAPPASPAPSDAAP